MRDVPLVVAQASVYGSVGGKYKGRGFVNSACLMLMGSSFQMIKQIEELLNAMDSGCRTSEILQSTTTNENAVSALWFRVVLLN